LNSPAAQIGSEIVADLELLTIDECVSVKKFIYDTRKHWVQRKPQVPFYTLGTVSYLDAKQKGQDYYQDSIGRTNPLLWSEFSWLYERLLDTLNARFEPTFKYHPARALPGFHIFLAHPAFTQVSASRHYDLQHEPLDWSALGEIEPAEQLSLTLSISLPSAGSGLMVWDINHLKLNEMTTEQQREVRRRNQEHRVHEYQAGHMAIHSGYYEHQIEPLRKYVAGEDRITLQAHTLPVGDDWIVYW